MTPIEQSLVLFIVGGINVLLTGWLGNYMSPLMAALFWSYPWTAIPPMFFMKWKGKSNLYLSKYMLSTTFALILLMGTAFLLSVLLKRAPKSESLWYPIIISLPVYATGAAIYYGIVKYFKLETYFM